MQSDPPVLNSTRRVERAAGVSSRCRRAWSTTIVVLAATGVLLAGCGSGSKPAPTSDYVKQVDSVAKGLSSATSGLGSATSGPEAASQLTTAQVALRKAGKQLGEITPPPDIKVAHERLVNAVAELANELTPVIAKLNAGDFQALASALSLKGVIDARAAIAAITNAGYKIQIPLVS